MTQLATAVQHPALKFHQNKYIITSQALGTVTTADLCLENTENSTDLKIN
jgi:hypothetical protein